MKKHDPFSSPESLFEGLKTLEVAPPPAVWADIEKSLNQRSRFRFVWIFGAIGLLGAGTLGLFFGLGQNQSSNLALATSISKTTALPSRTLAVETNVAAQTKALMVSETAPQAVARKSASANYKEASGQSKHSTPLSHPGMPSPEKSELSTPNRDFASNPSGANSITTDKKLNFQSGNPGSSWASLDAQPAPMLETIWPAAEALRSPMVEIPRRKRKAYNTIELFVGAGTFNQNLHMASDHADTLEFFARPGLMIQGGLQWALNPSLSIETSVAWSKNTWDSPASLIVEPNASSNSNDVFLSTPYVFSQVTDPEAVSGLMAEYAAQREARLEHVLSYMHYRVGLNYKMVDYRKMSFYVMLQAEYMQIQSYRGQITTGEFTLPYAVDGFRKGVMGIRPGIGLGYRISPRIQFFSEAATALRTSYLTEHSGWRIYENPYGLVAGIRFGR